MRVEIGAVATIPRDRGVRVTVGDDRIAMFRVGDEVYAIGDRCSHAEASLSEGFLSDREVECPRHGAVFDITTGKPKSLPATTPVPSYPVKLEGGTVYVLGGTAALLSIPAASWTGLAPSIAGSCRSCISISRRASSRTSS